MAAIAYLAGGISGALLLGSAPASRFVRFHAAQSLVTFGALSIAALALGSIPGIGWICAAALAPIGGTLWGALLAGTRRGQGLRLPVAGKLAERFISR